MADQLSDDFIIKKYYPNAIVGQNYTVGANPCTGKGGVTKTYKGTDIIADQIDEMSRKFPGLMNFANAKNMLANPTSFTPPAFKVDPKVAAGIAALSAAGTLSQLTGLGSNFLKPGLDASVQAVTSAISGATASLPFKTGSAADITTQIGAVKSMLQANVSGATSIIFKAVSSNFLSDIASAATKAAMVSLPEQISQLAGAAGSAAAFAAKAAYIAQTFPMIDVNKAAMMLINNVNGCKQNNINAMIPNMTSLAGAVVMAALPGKTPAKDAVRPQKTPNPPKMVKPVEMKNLFAEAAAGGSIATLKQPISQFMGIMSTIPSQNNLVADVPAKTSFGEQKLTSTANSVNWGSGGYGRNKELIEQEKKRLEIAAKIEKHTKELESMVDYSKLTSMPYSELIKKYPRITPKTTVAEALQIIAETDGSSTTTA